MVSRNRSRTEKHGIARSATTKREDPAAMGRETLSTRKSWKSSAGKHDRGSWEPSPFQDLASTASRPVYPPRARGFKSLFQRRTNPRKQQEPQTVPAFPSYSTRDQRLVEEDPDDYVKIYQYDEEYDNVQSDVRDNVELRDPPANDVSDMLIVSERSSYEADYENDEALSRRSGQSKRSHPSGGDDEHTGRYSTTRDDKSTKSVPAKRKKSKRHGLSDRSYKSSRSTGSSKPSKSMPSLKDRGSDSPRRVRAPQPAESTVRLPDSNDHESHGSEGNTKAPAAYMPPSAIRKTRSEVIGVYRVRTPVTFALDQDTARIRENITVASLEAANDSIRVFAADPEEPEVDEEVASPPMTCLLALEERKPLERMASLGSDASEPEIESVSREQVGETQMVHEHGVNVAEIKPSPSERTDMDLKSVASGFSAMFNLAKHRALFEPATRDQLKTETMPNEIKPEAQDIWTACKVGDAAFVRGALAFSAESVVNAEVAGKTPLYYACVSGHDDIVRLLLDAGARDKTKVIDGNEISDACRVMLNQYQHSKELPPTVYDDRADGATSWETGSRMSKSTRRSLNIFKHRSNAQPQAPISSSGSTPKKATIVEPTTVEPTEPSLAASETQRSARKQSTERRTRRSQRSRWARSRDRGSAETISTTFLKSLFGLWPSRQASSRSSRERSRSVPSERNQEPDIQEEEGGDYSDVGSDTDGDATYADGEKTVDYDTDSRYASDASYETGSTDSSQVTLVKNFNKIAEDMSDLFLSIATTLFTTGPSDASSSSKQHRIKH